MATVTKGDSTYNKLKEFFDGKGVPEYVWWSIIQAESGGNTQAIGDNGTSFGLFQIHGNFTAAEKSKLKNDPIYNAQRAYTLWTNRGENPQVWASGKAAEGTPEYVAYYWIYAQRPSAWTLYKQNGEVNADMEKVAKIAEANIYGASTDSTSENANNSGQAVQNSVVLDIVAAAVGIVIILIVISALIKEGAAGDISVAKIVGNHV